jgi:hypothetical protein
MGDTIRTIFFLAKHSPKEMFVTSGMYAHLFSGELQKIQVRSNYVLYFGNGDAPNPWVQRLFQQEVWGDALLVRTQETEEVNL